ncbi:MAG TPA: LssY C-terminal domain-containing protein [Bryobacteraceae bacterium]
MPYWYSLLFAAWMMSGVEVPEGTLLHIRLTTPVGSFASHPGSRVEAVLIAPVKIGGTTVVAPGSAVSGAVKTVRRVGLGLVHETASLKVEFDSISTPGGTATPLPARVIAVENGREEVSPSGSIREVRSTSSLGNRAAHFIRSAVLIDTHAQLAVWAADSLLLQMPEPEIFLPAGAELTLALTSPMRVAPVDPSQQPLDPPGFSEEERAGLDPMVSALPFRTQGAGSRPSDPVNLLLVGSRSEVAEAFKAAGWTEALPKTVRSRLSVIAAVVRGEAFANAPMAPLRLNDELADMSWEKGFNNFAKRHHIRLWKQGETADGQEIWAAAATHDMEYAYLRRGGGLATHQVARQLDRERDKVADDLVFTGCVDTAGQWDRPEFPRVMKGATGDILETDGRLAVLRLHRCDAEELAQLFAPTLPVHGGTWQMVLRREILSFRSDMIRHNWYWRGYEGARYLVAAIRHKPASEPEVAPAETRVSRLQPDWLTTIVSLR